MEDISIDKNKSNDLVITAVRQIGKTKREVGMTIGKSPMVFTQIEQYRNLVGFETLALMRKAYGLNLNAIVDEDEAHLFSEYSFNALLGELESAKKERDEIREERDFFKKIAMQGKKIEGLSKAKLNFIMQPSLIDLYDDFGLMASGKFDTKTKGDC